MARACDKTIFKCFTCRSLIHVFLLACRLFSSADAWLMNLCLQIPVFTALEKKTFKNIARKGENVGTQQFLLFSQSLFPIKDKNHHLTDYQSTKF